MFVFYTLSTSTVIARRREREITRDRQTDRQTERQRATDRETDRETDRDRGELRRIARESRMVKCKSCKFTPIILRHGEMSSTASFDLTDFETGFPK